MNFCMYLDPGFGGMLLQIIVAIAAVAGILLFSIRRKIRNLFSKNKESGPSRNTVGSNAAGVDNQTAGIDGDDVIDMLSAEKPTDEKPTDEKSADE